MTIEAESKDQELLLKVRRLFCLDGETGDLVRRTDRYGHAAGTKVGTKQKNGYLKLKFEGRAYWVHRLVWFIEHGEWPDGQIDHINGDRSDNRLSNLRVVTQKQNRQNLRKAFRTSSIGLLGVTKSQSGKNPFTASIKIEGRVVYLGVFQTKDLAHQAYIKAKRELHPFGTL